MESRSRGKSQPISGAPVVVEAFAGITELMPMEEISEGHVDVDAAVVLQQILDGELPENAAPLMGR